MKIRTVCWHSVIPDSIRNGYHDSADPTVSLFREQIRFIVDNYTPISIYDYMSILKENKPTSSYMKPPILLGFDDGFKNVISNALPILEEFNVPAVFFVLGEILNNPNFIPWYVEVKHLLRRTAEKTILFVNRRIELNSNLGHKLLRGLFGRSFKMCRVDKERQALLTYLAKALNVARPTAYELDEDLKFIGKEELSELNSSNLLTVASHAMTHRNLAGLTYEEQVYELKKSDAVLRKHFTCYYPIISYPDGSFNDETLTIAKRIYKFAFALFEGSSYGNCYAYPRYCLGSESVKELKYVLSPFRMKYLLPVKKLLHYAGTKGLQSLYLDRRSYEKFYFC